jgi:hypothetical protein
MAQVRLAGTESGRLRRSRRVLVVAPRRTRGAPDLGTAEYVPEGNETHGSSHLIGRLVFGMPKGSGDLPVARPREKL